MKITNMANTTCWIYVGIVAGLFCSGAVVAEEALAEVREPAIEQCVLLKLKSQDQPQHLINYSKRVKQCWLLQREKNLRMKHG